MKLVIVESPSKCKKIEEYLGEGYKVIASFGHIRELKTLKNIDTDNGFTPYYETIEEKEKQIDFIRKEIKKSEEVILATDNDNEGEAISWHICMVFELPIHKTKRIIFNEITKQAIKNAIDNPILLNMDIVNSQQTRQILDLLIGFNISPILWKHISAKSKSPLSAGRCQTSALRLIYDNYIEIRENNGIIYFKTIGYFTKLCIPFELDKDFLDKDEVEYFLEQSVNHKHILLIDNPESISKSPPKPFITSTIQQHMSNELNMSPKETMKICQELYELGYITYMRTNTKKYSQEFIKNIVNYLHAEWNLKPTPDEKLNDLDISYDKETNHEAIRPTNININEYTLKNGKVPEEFKKLEGRVIKVYNIIWKNSIQSCMNDALYYSMNIKIYTFDNTHFKYNSQKIYYDGWKFFDKKDKTNENNDEYNYFYNMMETVRKSNDNYEIDYIKIISEENIKKTKSHYTEAGLIKKLEELGIGRPSTFSMLVSKIQERQYVSKENINGIEKECVSFILQENEVEEKKIIKIFGNEKNKLIIKPLGIIVIEFVLQYFDNIFNYEYTKKMEFFLDEIENGMKQREEVCKTCNEELQKGIHSLNETKEGKCSNIKIDDTHTFIIGKHGPVVKNTDGNGKVIFMTVREGIDVKKIQNGNIEDIIDRTPSSIILGKYENDDLILKKGKYGIYVIYGNNKKSLSVLGNRPLENINYEEVVDILKIDENGEFEKNNDIAREKTFLRKVNDNISIRNGKYGNYIFFKTSSMKTPKFFKLNGFKENVIACELEILKKWIHEKYNIY